jgi:hypothetical protein
VNIDDAKKKKLVKKAVIAVRYDTSVRTIQEWMKGNIIPFYKIGYSVRFCPEECDAALAAFRR